MYIFRDHVVGCRHRRDILLNVFQERSAVLATSRGNGQLFLKLAGHVAPLDTGLLEIIGHRDPVKFVFQHTDDTDSDRHAS